MTLLGSDSPAAKRSRCSPGCVTLLPSLSRSTRRRFARCCTLEWQLMAQLRGATASLRSPAERRWWRRFWHRMPKTSFRISRSTSVRCSLVAAVVARRLGSWPPQAPTTEAAALRISGGSNHASTVCRLHHLVPLLLGLLGACTFALREEWLIGPTLYEELGRKHRGLGIPPTMTSTTAASPSLGHAATADTLDHERFERSLSSSEGDPPTAVGN